MICIPRLDVVARQLDPPPAEAIPIWRLTIVTRALLLKPKQKLFSIWYFKHFMNKNKKLHEMDR